MSSHPPPLPSEPPYQPTLTGPILITAAFAALLFCLPSLLGQTADLSCCPQNCCACLVAASLGIMPVMMFRRAGGATTPGLGCMIGLFGVGIGGVVGAIVQAQFPAYDPTALREALLDAFAKMEEQLEQDGKPVPFTREEFLTWGMWCGRYFVIAIVALSSLLAGGLGMIAASRRRPPSGPPLAQEWPPPPSQ